MTEPLMTSTILSATIAGAALAAVVVLALTGLKAWRDWLALQRLTLEGRIGTAPSPSSNARIEIADLKERVRKLEAIAEGVDL